MLRSIPSQRLAFAAGASALGACKLKPRRHATPRARASPTITQTTAASVDTNIRNLDDQTLMRMVTDFTSGFKSQPMEHAYWVEPHMVEGEIPKELEGTLLRNGPGLFEIGNASIEHPFDGDGMVCAFAFKDGRMFFRSKFVRTEAFVKEQNAGKRLYRSAFNKGNPTGGLVNPFDLATKNVANTNVIHWGGKTWALWEGGLPHELDRELRTLQCGPVTPAAQGAGAIAAHFRVVQQNDGSKRLAMFGMTTSGMDASVTMWEFDEQFNCLFKTTRVLPGAALGFFHDMAITEHYYVLIENPLRLDLPKFFTTYVLGQVSLAECLVFDESMPVKIHLIPRPGTGRPNNANSVLTFPYTTGTFFSFHHVNAFEEGDMVVIDTCAASRVDFSVNVQNISVEYVKNVRNRTELTRVVVDTKSGRVDKYSAASRQAEMPSVVPARSGRAHSTAFMLGGVLDSDKAFSLPQAVWKVNIPPSLGVTTPFNRAQISSQMWCPGYDQICSEPIFVPRSNPTAEDDGWVLTVVYDARNVASKLVVLDAQRVQDGPVASVQLPHHVPNSLHGTFTPSFLGPSPTSPLSSTTHDIRKGL